MENRIERTGAIVVVTLTGRIDSAGAISLDAAIKANILPADAAVLFDMAGVSYISSAGIRIFSALERNLKKADGHLCLCSLQPSVMKVLQITGHNRIFTICPTREAGISCCRRDTRLSYGGAGSPVMAHVRLASEPLAYHTAVLTINGDSGRVCRGITGPGDLFSRVFIPDAFTAGIGAPGESAEECMNQSGLLLAIGGSIFWKPFDSSDPPDFLIPKGDAPRLLLQTAFAITLDDPFHEILDAEPVRPGGVSLADLCSDIFCHAKATRHEYAPVMGLVLYAGISGTDREGSGSSSGQGDPEGSPADRTLVAYGVAVDTSADLSAYDPDLLRMILCQNDPGTGEKDPFLYLYGLVFDTPPSIKTLDIARLVAATVTQESCTGLLLPDSSTKVSHAVLGVSYLSGIEHEWKMPVRIMGDCPGWNRTCETVTRWMHPGCQELELTPLTGGFSGTLVFRVRAKDANGRSMMPLVMKLGPWTLIEPEIRGYTDHVRRYIQNNATQIIQTERIGEYGGILYNFVGISGAESSIFSLEDYYLSHDPEEIVPVIDTLFSIVLNGWYGEPKKREMLLYQEYNRFWKYDTIRSYAAGQFGADPKKKEIDLPFGLGPSINPIWFVEMVMPGRLSRSFPVYESSVHCDLNMRNVLMDEKKNMWLIDFADTKYSHILRDIIKLEAVIKGEMVPVHSREILRDLACADAVFLSARSLSDIPAIPAMVRDPAMEKGFRIVQALRRHAARITLEDDDIAQYYLGLLPYTLNLLSYISVNEYQKEYGWIASSLICKRLLELQP